MKTTKLTGIPIGKEKVLRHTGCIRVFDENKIQLFFNNPDTRKDPISDISVKKEKLIPTYFFRCYDHTVRASSDCTSIQYGFTKK